MRDQFKDSVKISWIGVGGEATEVLTSGRKSGGDVAD